MQLLGLNAGFFCSCENPKKENEKNIHTPLIQSRTQANITFQYEKKLWPITVYYVISNGSGSFLLLYAYCGRLNGPQSNIGSHLRRY